MVFFLFAKRSKYLTLLYSLKIRNEKHTQHFIRFVYNLFSYVSRYVEVKVEHCLLLVLSLPNLSSAIWVSTDEGSFVTRTFVGICYFENKYEYLFGICPRTKTRAEIWYSSVLTFGQLNIFVFIYSITVFHLTQPSCKEIILFWFFKEAKHCTTYIILYTLIKWLWCCKLANSHLHICFVKPSKSKHSSSKSLLRHAMDERWL